MAALILNDFSLPNEMAEGIFKKAQTGSVISKLSGERPFRLRCRLRGLLLMHSFAHGKNLLMSIRVKARVAIKKRRRGTAVLSSMISCLRHPRRGGLSDMPPASEP